MKELPPFGSPLQPLASQLGGWRGGYQLVSASGGGVVVLRRKLQVVGQLSSSSPRRPGPIAHYINPHSNLPDTPPPLNSHPTQSKKEGRFFLIPARSSCACVMVAVVVVVAAAAATPCQDSALTPPQTTTSKFIGSEQLLE